MSPSCSQSSRAPGRSREAKFLPVPAAALPCPALPWERAWTGQGQGKDSCSQPPADWVPNFPRRCQGSGLQGQGSGTAQTRSSVPAAWSRW